MRSWKKILTDPEFKDALTKRNAPSLADKFHSLMRHEEKMRFKQIIPNPKMYGDDRKRYFGDAEL